MKIKIFTLFFFISCFFSYSQAATKIYTALPLSETIYNPERGFYIHTEVFSKVAYEELDLASLNQFKSQNYSLILRVFYLENFINSDISASYLNSVNKDFNLIRTAGLKCIVRFAYSNSDASIGSYDAPKTQMLRHISQLKPIFEQNVDVIYVVQLGFIGAWGEWYYTDFYGNKGQISTAQMADRKEIVLKILASLPSSRMVQIRTPYFKKKIFATNNFLTKSEAFNKSNKSRVGHHNDCFLASDDDFGTYDDVLVDYPYLAGETLYTPMGGETCFPNPPRSNCPTALAELKKFHWSYLNVAYNPTVITGFKTGGCYSTIANKLGYRFELINGTYTDMTTLIKKTFSILINVKNVGFTSLFNERPVFLILRNIVSLKEFSIKLNTDPRHWLSDTIVKISQTVSLPTGITIGNYGLFLNLPDLNVTLSKRPEYSIRLANLNLWESKTGYNDLQHVLSVK
ncbi:unnamed protein product [Brachionus calyciflorus]|uniref:DUF4874 domain-containing protein n=1 Tax=Brachionus calyciflorus TaxID=104777 RepID=A0A814Q9E7_9BILA|nr:unnamed protein product [Brachionus calyciflorus]